MDKSEFLKLNLPSRNNTTDVADINVISENFEIIDEAFAGIVDDVLPEYQTKENMNLNFDDNSTNEEQYPSVPAVVNFTNRKVNPLKIVNSASGNAIALKDSANDKLVNLKLYGKTTQDGTPTPTEPKELKSVGDSGSFDVGVYGKNIFNPNDIYKQNYIINPDGTEKQTDNWVITKAIPISEKGLTVKVYATSEADEKIVRVGLYNANGFVSRPTVTEKTFTQADGTYIRLTYYQPIQADGTLKFQVEVGTQATPYEPPTPQTLTMPYTLRSDKSGVTDEIDLSRGVHTQNVQKFVANGSEDWWYDQDNTRFALNFQTGAKSGAIKCWSSHYVQGETLTIPNSFNMSNGIIYINDDRFTNATDFKNWLSSNNVTFYYPRATPIETPLTETELNVYRHLMTNKGNTTFISDADMEVSYVADTKLYIDNKIAELTALTLEG
jgi:hypothetical protein